MDETLALLSLRSVLAQYGKCIVPVEEVSKRFKCTLGQVEALVDRLNRVRDVSAVIKWVYDIKSMEESPTGDVGVIVMSWNGYSKAAPHKVIYLDVTLEGLAGMCPNAPRRSAPNDGQAEARFDEFWKHYPRKDAKKGAKTKFLKLSVVDQAAAIKGSEALAAVWRKRVAEGDSKSFCPMPVTWLNNERWNDEELQQPVSPSGFVENANA